jgi:hypothetical protein
VRKDTNGQTSNADIPLLLFRPIAIAWCFFRATASAINNRPAVTILSIVIITFDQVGNRSRPEPAANDIQSRIN